MGHHHHHHHGHHHHHHYGHYTHTYQPVVTPSGNASALTDLLRLFESPAASVYDGLGPNPGIAQARAAAERADFEKRALAERIASLRGVHRTSMRTVDWPAHASSTDAEVQALAARVLTGDSLAYREALAACESLVEVRSHVGTDGVQVALSEKHAHVDLRAPLGDAIPTENGTMIRTASDRLDLYQDYVCGIALRAGRELLAALPLDEVTVDLWNVTAAEDDTSGGGYRDAEKPPTNLRIASMRCVRAAMESIDWATADASEVVGVLAHEMDFRAGEGFYGVAHVTRE